MFERTARTQSQAEYGRSQAGRTASTAGQWQRESETWFDGSPESVDRRLAQCERMLHQARAGMARDGLRHGSKHIDTIASLEVDKGALLALRRDLLTAASDRAPSSARADAQGAAQHERETGHTVSIHGDEAQGYSISCPQCEGGHHANLLTAASDREHPVQQGDLVKVHGQPGKLLAVEDGAHYVAFDDGTARWLGDKGKGEHEAALSPQDRRFVELESAKFIANNTGIPLDEVATRARNHVELRTSDRDVIAAFVGKVAQLHRQTPQPRTASAPRAVPDFPAEMMYL